MARFYGEVYGQSKTKASRIGSSKSGMYSHIRGWDVGVKVRCFVNYNGEDVIEVYKTGGSNQPSEEIPIITMKQNEDTEY